MDNSADDEADKHKDSTQNQILQEAAEDVQLQQKFLCGLGGNVRQNVFFLDDAQTIIYPCGHNVIIYNMEDKSQKYI